MDAVLDGLSDLSRVSQADLHLQDDATIEFATIPLTGARVGCYVHDNGAGFDPAYTAKLFQPFQQLHLAGEHAGTGIGTGLAIVRRIIERHGGQAWAEGAEGQGAVFYLTFAPPGTPGNGQPDLLARSARDDVARSWLAQPGQAAASATPVPATGGRRWSPH